MTIPAKVQQRRDELMTYRVRQDLRLAEMRDRHEAEIRAIRELSIEIDAEFAGLALADAAYAEQAPEPAAETEWTRTVAATRAPRRDIPGMVLVAVRETRDVGATLDALVRLLNVPPSRIRAAVERSADLWMVDDRVMHKDFLPRPAPQQLDAAAE